ncbi:MAG TPA: hypothetical protein VN765_07405, partial [Candidatus Acidoferrum sp.]|nr:hypothetical protein [Candidatus Acidoferrum sp.]
LGGHGAGGQCGGGEDGFLNGFSSCHHNESFPITLPERTGGMKARGNCGIIDSSDPPWAQVWPATASP